MNTYINRILNITNSNCNEKTIKDDIQEDLDYISELYCDRNDTRLHEIYLKYVGVENMAFFQILIMNKTQ